MPEPAIIQAARATVRYWDPYSSVIMVAIGGPESGHDEDIPGDHVSIFPLEEQQAYAFWACNGYTSFGWLQINLRWNYDKVEIDTGSRDPCTMAAYLNNYDHCARVGRRVFDSQGFGAWTAFNNRSYLSWVNAAQSSVEFVLGHDVETPPTGFRQPIGIPKTPPSRAKTPPGG